MAIDARVNYVVINEDGTGELRLVDRPPQSAGSTPGIAGQSALYFGSSPEEVTALNGRNIWGGSFEIMLGDVKIATRVGYTIITFVDGETFKRAVAAYEKANNQ